MNSCGAELAEDAVVPEQLAQLMRHVAVNLDAHAQWVGTSSVEAEAECNALTKLAETYRAIAEAAEEAAKTMRAMRGLLPAYHDPAGWDRDSFRLWMQRKIDLQRAFARLVLEHAETSDRVLAGG